MAGFPKCPVQLEELEGRDCRGHVLPRAVQPGHPVQSAHGSLRLES